MSTMIEIAPSSAPGPDQIDHRFSGWFTRSVGLSTRLIIPPWVVSHTAGAAGPALLTLLILDGGRIGWVALAPQRPPVPAGSG